MTGKSRSAITGRYATAKAAKAKPETHVVSDDYPARMLRKLVRVLETRSPEFSWTDTDKLIANIKRRMGWLMAQKKPAAKLPKPVEPLSAKQEELLKELQSKSPKTWLLFVNCGYSMADAKALHDLGLIRTKLIMGMPAAKIRPIPLKPRKVK